MQNYFYTSQGTQFTSSWQTRAPFNSSQSSVNVVRQERQMSNVTNGLVIGNFKDPNPITFLKRVTTNGNRNSYDRRASGGNIVVTTVSGPSPAHGDMSLNSPVLGGADFSRTRDDCLEKVFGQLRNGPNLAVDWAERVQTAKLLKDSLNLRKLILTMTTAVTGSTRYKRLPKGDAGVQPRIDLLSQKWLEYRYGWTPLVNSIYDIVDQVRRSFMNETSGTFNVKGRSSQRRILGPDEVISKGGAGSFENPRCTVTGSFRYRTEMGFIFKIPQGTNLSDFTTLNPLTVAWELTPYSFVADWFVNVSQYLELWENWVLFNKHFQGGYITDSFQEKTIWSTSGATSVPWRFDGPTPVQGQVSYVSVNGSKTLSYKARERVLNLPFPSGIRLRVNLNAKRVTDSAALLFQVANRKLPGIPRGTLRL